MILDAAIGKRDSISIFGTDYDTPDGMQGSIGAPGSNVSAVSLTQSLKRSVVSAVSAVIPVSATPTHMKSEEAFKTYLDKLDFAHKSYSVGNELNAQASQIKAAPMRNPVPS